MNFLLPLEHEKECENVIYKTLPPLPQLFRLPVFINGCNKKEGGGRETEKREKEGELVLEVST